MGEIVGSGIVFVAAIRVSRAFGRTEVPAARVVVEAVFGVARFGEPIVGAARAAFAHAAIVARSAVEREELASHDDVLLERGTELAGVAGGDHRPFLQASDGLGRD